jgi:hypothetical protein
VIVAVNVHILFNQNRGGWWGCDDAFSPIAFSDIKLGQLLLLFDAVSQSQ